MLAVTSLPESPAAIRVDLGAIFLSMELSRSKWLITSLSPGGGEEDVEAHGGRRRPGRSVRVLCFAAGEGPGADRPKLSDCRNSGGGPGRVLDPPGAGEGRDREPRGGPCLDRRLPAGAAGQTDKIDGEALVRTLLAYKRGEPRVCSMVRAPSPQEEDRRRILGSGRR